MSALKRKIWSVTFYDEGKEYGPVKARGYPMTEVEATLFAIREAKRPDGFSLNVRFVATPVDGRKKGAK